VSRHDLAPTGSLRAAINLGNPVLTHGTPAAPGGVTVAIAGELSRRLGVALELVCVDAARKSFTSLVDGSVDVSFLAIEPAREEDVAFSPPYLAIEGVYVVPADAPFGDASAVDRPGVTIGVKEGSAYDLYLTRTLEHAEVVRGSEGTTVLVDRAADVGAGIRQPVTAFVGDAATYRVLEPAFMQIRQAVGVARDRGGDAAAYVAEVVSDLVASGFVRAELALAGQDPDLALDR
jgi:polar amino acid transport system substrate-binding protein